MRDTQVNFRVSEEEHAAYTDAAENAGLSLSFWCRVILASALGDDDLRKQLVRAARTKGGPWGQGRKE